MNRIGNLFCLFALVTLLVYTQSLALGRIKINVANETTSSTTPEPCPANEEYYVCIDCEEPTCVDYSEEICLDNDDCDEGCQCVKGYVRNNGTCILKSECS